MSLLPNPDMVERYREIMDAWGEPQSYVYMAGLMAGLAELAAEDHQRSCDRYCCAACTFFQQAIALKSAMDLEAGPPPYWQ